MKKNILFIGIIFLCCNAYTQTIPAIEKEAWNNKPTLQVIDKKYATESAIVLLDKRQIEFIDDAQGNVIEYKTVHKITHINDDKGIESFNKVYLPVSDNADLIDVKARTILPNGKTIDLDKKNIKDLQEDERNYKIFALEGLEKGCEVEYYYTYIKNASYFGREVLQLKIPVLQAYVKLITPERLSFETKFFNSNATTIDTILNKKKYITVALQNLTGAEDEKYSTYTANLARVEYKLSYNSSKSSIERIFTWNELAKRIYENYTTLSSKEIKKVEDLIEKNEWLKLSTEKEKIIAVENYFKKNIGTREDVNNEDALNIEKILKNKLASYAGIIKLYGAVYTKLGIDIQYVLSGDRETFTIDKTFENWNNCENALIYFNKQKKYIAPTKTELRYPWIEPNWGNTNALFCKGTTIGNFTTAMAEIKQVQLEDFTQTASNIEAKIELNTTADTLLINLKQLHTGYSAGVYRAIFNFSSAEQQKRYLKEFVKFGTNSENIVSSKLENIDFESYSDNKPFILNATVKANELIEKAGTKVLIKIGDIIGPQAEMYQEKPRLFPMEIEYPHSLGRKIEFIIPDGYIVKNLQELKIKDIYQENGEITMGFVSDYKQEGNTVTINVMEEYKKTHYPLSQYEAFKKIINAAADFNKIVLVLEKK